MSEFFIKIGKEQVCVREEIYKEYYKMKRRERYLEEDIKVGRIAVDSETETFDFVPSKEDSINVVKSSAVTNGDKSYYGFSREAVRLRNYIT